MRLICTSRGNLAKALAKAKSDPAQLDWVAANAHLAEGSRAATAWGVPLRKPSKKGPAKTWKHCLNTSAEAIAYNSAIRNLIPRESSIEKGGAQADLCYAQGVNVDTSMTESQQWHSM